MIHLVALLLSVTMIWPQMAISEEYVTISSENFQPVELYENALISFDPAEDIKTVMSGDVIFQKNPRDMQKTSASSHYWLKFSVWNTTAHPIAVTLVYAYAFLESAEVFKSTESADLRKAAGNAYPTSQREVWYRKPAIALALNPGPSTYFIKVKYPSIKPAYFSLYSEKGFNTFNLLDTAMLSFGFGIMIFSLIYNWFLYQQLRYSYILSYLIFLVGATLTNATFTGLIEFILPDGNHSLLNPVLNIGWSFVIQVLIGHFAVDFLDLRSLHPYAQRFKRDSVLAIAILLAWLCFEGFVLSSVMISGLVTGLMTPLIMIFLIYIGYSQFRKGYQPAIYYLLSWTPCLLGTTGMLLVMVEVIGWIPTSELWTSIGTCIQVSVLSMALGNRVKSDTDRLNRKVAETNERLQRHVEHLDELVTEKTARTLYILDNVNIGIFRIGTDRIIDPEHSRATPALFERGDIRGLTIEELLFSNGSTGASCEQRDMLNSALNATLGEPDFSWDFNSHALPREITCDEGRRIIELDWAPIVEDQTVQGCLVIARDIAYTRHLEAESRKTAEEMKLIAHISGKGRERVVNYIQSEQQLSRKTRKLIQAMGKKNPYLYNINLSSCLRNLHTIKGNARTYGFDEVSSLIHQCEKEIKRSSDIDDINVSVTQINETLDSIDRFFADCLDTINRYIPAQGDQEKSARDVTEAAAMLETLELVSIQISPDLNDRIRKVAEFIRRWLGMNLADIIEPIRQDLPRISKRLGKDTPEIILKGEPLFVRKEFFHTLQSLLIHLIRNAVDHGLESPLERTQAHKSLEGKITISVTNMGQFHRLVIEDDGRGLAIRRIHQKAIERGFVSRDDSPNIADLAGLIFLPGFTSRQEGEATEISGHGVGMDAVKELLAEVSGSIIIQFVDPSVETIPLDQYQGSYVHFRFVIALPRRICA